MPPEEEVLVVGAGPFGLSISAHLHGRGVSHTIVGKPLDTWRAHMPLGSKLRSEPYGSDMSAPRRGYDVEAHAARFGLDYVRRLGPLPIEQFLTYGDWFTEQLVPGVLDATVTEIAADGDAFRVTFADADPVRARQVVVATGVLPYRVRPTELDGLPADLVSHSSDIYDLEAYRGRRVVVVGGGQSATETAALLHESGADVTIVARRQAINWLEPNPAELSRLGRIKRPDNKLCEGWHCQFYYTPAAFRLLPESIRYDKARTTLGPAGAWWLKDRVDGVIETLTSHQVRGARAVADGVQLTLDGPRRTTVEADHVVAATGFRVNVAGLPFLPAGLSSRIATVGGYPQVSRAGESTVPGLYFAGAPAAVSNGPSTRFIAGTHTTVPQMTKAMARRARTSTRTQVSVAASSEATA